MSAADFVAAIPHLERAIELDPKYGQAFAALAAVYWKSFRQGISWSSMVNPEAGRQHSSLIATQEKARQYLTRAMSNPSPLAHQVASAALLHFRQFDEAFAEAERATALNPNDPDGYAATAWAKLYLGRPEEALEAVDRAADLTRKMATVVESNRRCREQTAHRSCQTYLKKEQGDERKSNTSK